MYKILIFFLILTSVACKNNETTIIESTISKINIYNLLKEVIFNNYDLVDKKMEKINKYAEIKYLRDRQINSIFPDTVRDSIQDLKNQLLINNIILINSKCLLFELKVTSNLKRKVYYLLTSNDNDCTKITTRNFHFENKYKINEDWMLATKINTMAN